MSSKALHILAAAAAAVAVGLSFTAQAQSNFQTGPCTDKNGSNSLSGDSRYSHCEVRTAKLAATGQPLQVEAVNGGISVVGEDRSDIELQARIFTTASSQADADSRAQETKIETEGNHIRSNAPHSWRGGNHQAVSFSLRVPHRYAVKLTGENGGLSVSNLDGAMDLRTENGGLSLKNCAGDIHSRTENGSINIAVAGDSWQGTGIVAETTNGSASVTLPENFSAHLEAGVVNGSIHTDFPLTMSHFNSKEISADIGKGGAPIKLHSVNGSVSIRRAHA